MASTRNKNTPGNYALEQWSLDKQYQSQIFVNGAQGRPVEPLYAGDGLNGGRIVGRDLAKNDCDIESFLFGIGSTNLVSPLPVVRPELRELKSLDIIQKKPMFVPEALIVEPHQRHFYLN